MSEYITDYESKIGKIQIAATEEAVTGLWFYGQKYFASTLEQEYEKKTFLYLMRSKNGWTGIFQGKICKSHFRWHLREVIFVRVCGGFSERSLTVKL